MNKFFTLLLVFLVCQTTDLSAQAINEIQVSVTNAQLLGTTPPLRNLVPNSPMDRDKRAQLKANKKVPPNFYNANREGSISNPNAQPQGADPVRQTQLLSTGFIVEPLVNVEGLDFQGPPDPSGDVGLDHYVQAVNATAIEVFDKEGNSQGAIATNTLWSQVNSTGAGDPIIIYDQEVNRWLITEFTAPGINTFLIGISENADPFSSYTVYSFGAPNFPDYPKYAVWKDLYTISSNEEGDFAMVQYFLDKNAMLAGEPNPTIQRVTIPATPGGPGIFVSSPVDWSGSIEPTNGNPIFLSLDDDEWGGTTEDLIKVHTFEVDFDNSNNTTVTTQDIVVAPYDTDPCFPGTGQFGECIQQAGNGGGFSGITQVIMNQSHYRNFNTHESMVFCFTVDATAGEDIAGIRWTELRRNPGETDWSLYQEGTYSLDDGLERFVPSIAMDGSGNIGLGYSVSSPDIFPQLRFTGRRVSDPLGEMTVEEYTLAEGISTLNTFARFGDYAHMTIDPTDESTFWFTGEYAGQNTAATRVASFQIRRDTTDFSPVALVTPQDADDLTATETVQIQIKNTGLDTPSVFKVGYIFENQPAVVDDVTFELWPDSVYTHTFLPTVDLSAVGEYEFKIFNVLPDDQAIFNDTLRQVVRKLPRWDVGIVGVDGLDEVSCSDNTEASFELINFGTETLTSALITIEINGNVLPAFTWTGELATGESELVPLILTDLQNGDNLVIASASEPNGMTDEIPENNSFTREFNAIVGGTSVFVRILTDNYPGETTWEVREEDGDVIYTGGPYNQGAALQEAELCMDTSQCYTFTIFDAYGDGICCGFGLGNYEILDINGNPLVQDNGEFGFEESYDFCPIFECTLEASVDVSPDINMEGNGTIMITPTNGTAPYQYSIDGGDTFSNNDFYDNLPAGTYVIVVEDASGCQVISEIEVEMIVPTNEDQLNFAFEVMPNPTSDVFRINVSGLEKTEVFLPYEILDATGKRVQNGQLPKYDGVYTGMVSLYVYPSGVYFVRFLDNKVQRMLRVVKN